MKNTELLAVVESTVRSIDAEGSSSLLKRNLRRAFVLRGRYFKYLLLRFSPAMRRTIKEWKGRTAWGRPFVAPTEDGYGISLACFGLLNGPDVRIAEYLIKNLEEDNVFYDIGANYGFYSMLAEELVPRGEVHVFEPVEQVFSYLERNFGGNVFLNKVAVSDATGESAFYESYSAASSGMSTLREDVSRNDEKTFRPVRVATVTLNDYIKNHRPPTVIKIDIEGAEYKALSGAREMLIKRRPKIIMEVWLAPSMNREHLRAAEFLRGLGYSSFALTHGGGLEKVPDLAAAIRQSSGSAAANDNFIFQCE